MYVGKVAVREVTFPSQGLGKQLRFSHNPPHEPTFGGEEVTIPSFTPVRAYLNDPITDHRAPTRRPLGLLAPPRSQPRAPGGYEVIQTSKQRYLEDGPIPIYLSLGSIL